MKSTELVSLAMFHLRSFSQQKINGSIMNAIGEPLNDVSVTLFQNGRILSSQFTGQGKFILFNLNRQEYRLSVTLSGYQSILLKFKMPVDIIKLTMQVDKQQCCHDQVGAF